MLCTNSVPMTLFIFFKLLERARLLPGQHSVIRRVIRRKQPHPRRCKNPRTRSSVAMEHTGAPWSATPARRSARCPSLPRDPAGLGPGLESSHQHLSTAPSPCPSWNGCRKASWGWGMKHQAAPSSVTREFFLKWKQGTLLPSCAQKAEIYCWNIKYYLVGKNIVLVQQVDFSPAFTSWILRCSFKWYFTFSGTGLPLHADICETKIVRFSQVSHLRDGLSAGTSNFE